LPRAGFEKILPVDGAFYLYADASRFCDDSFDFAKRMLEETHVAITPGIDFDPLRGKHFIRFCLCGLAAEMHEAGGADRELARSLIATASPLRYCHVDCGDVGRGLEPKCLVQDACATSSAVTSRASRFRSDNPSRSRRAPWSARR